MTGFAFVQILLMKNAAILAMGRLHFTNVTNTKQLLKYVRVTKKAKKMKENTAMSVDIRTYTRVIIIKNREYLVGREVFSRELKWSTSPWDAWWTRNVEDAAKVANSVSGMLVLFNPVIGETKMMKV